MRWDNSPVYWRRRALVLVVGLLVLWLLYGAISALVGRITRPDPAPVAAEPATGPASTQPRQPRTGKAEAITIAFAGDVNAHGESQRINDVGLGETGKVLAQADLAMVNLETVIAADRTGLKPQPKQFTFATGPKLLETLKASGVDVVSAANNHTMDFGATGMERMLAAKAASPVPMVGLGANQDEAWAPWTTEVKGRKVVVFAATDVLESNLDWKAGPTTPGLAKIKDEDGFQRLLDRVTEARKASPDDVIVVYLHSGIELERCPTQRQQLTDRMLAEAGADVVVGSHAHILQTTTTIGDTAIAYGMGNFVFEAHKDTTRATGVLSVTVPGTPGAPSMDFAPARIDKGVPTLLTGAEREAALAQWSALGKGCS